MMVHRFWQMTAVLLICGWCGVGLAQTPAPTPAPATSPTQAPAPKGKCGPDHIILYKRAVKLLDNAEKKLNARYTAEAKALAKEANSLFTILQRECGQEQKERVLTDKEVQQEAINQKLHADEFAQAERLEKSAGEKLKKSEASEANQPELSLKYVREAKQELEQAHKRYIKAEIYALRNQQMTFQFLNR